MINRLASFILVGFIHFYRLTFSSFMGRQCRFLPTCSAYGLEAIQKHGAWRGSVLTAKRLCKCHPFESFGGKSGFDPVP
ncbi:MAG: hypothetical protein JWM96_239 [Alphaproteobacteria bacterium]|nr:hypothetical protein [Alphaproteobacteria bacterium]